MRPFFDKKTIMLFSCLGAVIKKTRSLICTKEKSEKEEVTETIPMSNMHNVFLRIFLIFISDSQFLFQHNEF